MRVFDNLLMIAAGFCLYSLSIVFSNQYFAGINQLIPDIFSGRATIILSSTFHLVMGSLMTGLLLVRFAPKPIFVALLIAIAINLESYLLLLQANTFDEVMKYYLAKPSRVLNLFQPLVLLPLVTYLLGFLPRAEPTDNKSAN
ncbi:MAG: hypothetical protein COA74_03170 [Gammaproteobacteria bacterium]|nr:MAG: hypothetical protein COA74_03170 [Gammaproteobacteria bacterium]